MADGIDGFASAILEDVIKAELSMHHAQIKGWAWMYKHFAPKSDQIPDSIMSGSMGNRYLGIANVEMDLYLIPVESKSYWQRFKLGVGLLFGKRPHFFANGTVFEYGNAGDLRGQKLTIQVKRDSTGAFKMHYDKTP